MEILLLTSIFCSWLNYKHIDWDDKVIINFHEISYLKLCNWQFCSYNETLFTPLFYDKYWELLYCCFTLNTIKYSRWSNSKNHYCKRTENKISLISLSPNFLSSICSEYVNFVKEICNDAKKMKDQLTHWLVLYDFKSCRLNYETTQLRFSHLIFISGKFLPFYFMN